MAKHVYPPLGVGVADTASIDLNLDVNRIITAFTIYGGSGGDFGVSPTSARSDHTHVTSYDGRYVLKAGDTMTGGLSISSGGLSVTGGNISTFGTVSAGTGIGTLGGGASIIGNSTVTGTLGVSALLTASAGLIVSASGLTVSGGGAVINGSVQVNSGVMTVLTKGSVFGQSTGGNTALTQADAAIMLYANSANNWAGMGADTTGGIWFRTGTSGTPDYRLYVDSAGNVTIKDGALRVNKNRANLTLNATTAGQQAELWFEDGGTQKWALYKLGASNGLAIWNSGLGKDVFSLSNTTGQPFFDYLKTSASPLHGGVVTTDDSGFLSPKDLTGTGTRLMQATSQGIITLSAPEAAGAAVTLLYDGVFSSVASVSLPNGTFTTGWSYYIIQLSNVTLATVSQGLFWRGRTAGTDDSGANTYKSRCAIVSTAGVQTLTGLSSTLGLIIPAVTSGTVTSSDATLHVQQPANSGMLTMVYGQMETVHNGVDWFGGWFSGQYTTAKAHDALTFVAGSGNVSMTVAVWGFRFV